MRLLHPGEILREKLDALELSASALAKALDVSAGRIRAILSGKRGVSANTALRLARYFDTTPEFWLNLQKAWELRREEIEEGLRIAERVEPRHPGRAGGKNKRFDERNLKLIDLIGRFEADPSSTHAYNALSAIGRLKDDGAIFWKEGSSELTRWRRACTELWQFINAELGRRRHIEKQNLATALREFIQEFEHSIGGMYEMLYGISDGPDDNPDLERMFRWFEVVYRISTYAIISFWIPDKTERNSVKITTNFTTGKCRAEWTREEMKVPKEYRRATRKL